jgi:hypothetical protein
VRTAPKEASQVMMWIGELYGLERSAKKKRLDDDEREDLRQQRSKPILDRIHDYLKQIAVTALPKSPLGDAIGYALRQWNALNRYVEDGSLEIDNNGAENALRPLCLGRNYPQLPVMQSSTLKRGAASQWTDVFVPLEC